MKIARSLQRGITILELMLVVVIIGVLGFIATTRFIKAKDRSYVGAAQSELNSVRQAIAMYAADHGAFPVALGSVNELNAIALDPEGKPYMTLPGRPQFAWISYLPDDNLGYVLRVQAHDHSGTIIRATGDGMTVEG
jgi:type II secretory pathway pseudopilin PulG